MRLSDDHLLQMIGDNHYVLIEDHSGTEVVLTSDVLARLAVCGVGYFASVDPTLTAACYKAAADNPQLPTLRLPKLKGE